MSRRSRSVDDGVAVRNVEELRPGGGGSMLPGDVEVHVL